MLPTSDFLAGKRGLVVGVANEQSIAAGCARVCRGFGADIAMTYQSEKARKFVQPVADAVESELFLPMDVTDMAQMDAVFEAIRTHWGRLDFLVHSVAYCPADDLHGRVVDCSRDGFGTAMDVSVHSLIRLAKRAEPLMSEGGTILTVSYHGAERVVDHYNVMGPVKAALEATVRYLAVELGPKDIRVNAMSPGPLETRAASGIAHFDVLIEDAKKRSPLQRLTTIEEVGAMAACLVSDLARSVSGNTSYIDGGHHIV
ncbi:enoyl-ACP reductase FabI [Hoeflea prorocentri]|uniref:Enoyl-[acyl-carrier-protein] reductase [NADH] n=1 Tax=Hoeflea prorocentri TaxID=1922333 RepID=A0A9X3UDZ9_9HYPH|nr:enoyl-ACP reductase FabI [Hoeflea prorocentri]MCY6379562.1 enoyl-ACP reductase FabI [Hoeflea prorocentri]MDA5397362.1 enoyl-ACP reductase FabI [Hoeflea prorocentri]